MAHFSRFSRSLKVGQHGTANLFVGQIDLDKIPDLSSHNSWDSNTQESVKMVKKRKNNGRNKKGEHHRTRPPISSQSSLTHTLQAAVTSSPSAAPIAHDAHPRTRPLSGSPSATWLSLPLFVCSLLCDRDDRSEPDTTPHTHQTSANKSFPQVISAMLQSSLSTLYPRCTSSCSIVSLALSTARLSGTFVPLAGTTASASLAMRAAEMNLGRTSISAASHRISIPIEGHIR